MNNFNNDEFEVAKTVRLLSDLMIKKDTAEMNKILDENFTLTHITGYVQSKLEWFNEVSRETMKYYSSNEVSFTSKLNDNRVDVTVQNLVNARIWGIENTWRLEQKMKLEKRNDKWIILQSIATTF